MKEMKSKCEGPEVAATLYIQGTESRSVWPDHSDWKTKDHNYMIIEDFRNHGERFHLIIFLKRVLRRGVILCD